MVVIVLDLFVLVKDKRVKKTSVSYGCNHAMISLYRSRTNV